MVPRLHRICGGNPDTRQEISYVEMGGAIQAVTLLAVANVVLVDYKKLLNINLRGLDALTRVVWSTGPLRFSII